MATTNDIGDDILDVLEELGSVVTVYNYDSDTTTTEYVDPNYEVNHVYPWTSHFVMKMDFGYSTVAVPGDLLTIDGSLRYLVVALAKERFENKCIAKEGVVYLCNTFAQVTRRVETRVDYDMQVSWPIIHSGEYALFSGDRVELDEYQDEKYGIFILQKDRLYISDSIDVQPGDRVWLKETMDVSGEAMEVRNIEKRMFPGIKICLLGQDTRE